MSLNYLSAFCVHAARGCKRRRVQVHGGDTAERLFQLTTSQYLQLRASCIPLRAFEAHKLTKCNNFLHVATTLLASVWIQEDGVPTV
eukprot:5119-Chlamydomonas_euryale.AAC.6